MNTAQPSWPGDIHRELTAAAVRQVAYVPDAGHSELIERCRLDNAMTAVPLTTEEEGIGVLAGAWLGGQRGVLLMQSSGIGNCVNMFGFAKTCRLPLLLLATMRGQWGEFNPWQLPMGQNAGPVLEASGVMVFPVEEAAQVGETVAAAARMVFEGSSSAAVLIGQRVVGVKSFDKD
ncbi:MAG: thiamine pyrophosphate-binding protein [Alphaproteobacteria bacterium]|jgi:sulfopyruvate decarboxylase alpha subunit|nr:phosphonopyruvate decarboxylase [Rhodospirillaceae bacterium]MDP6404324.1 thiamine pyrophosphate-binding protein [Alphaproteobacteria bacterium]MDP6624735.1 thiamine pyrophosphate-binding protein [Alphaproteobacteria bacterium]|tara:strand:+ start:361 stop:888 length:528 start_codon:yes stop_codon:yes gene_type:complete